MAKSDVVVIWGTNAANTQVNVMTHATRARKERGAKLVVVDVYMNADDAASRFGGADPARHRRRARLRGDALPVPRRQSRLGLSRSLCRCPARARRACARPRSAWASQQITGCPTETIEAFAALVGEQQTQLFRLGYGFSRSRNGAINMHAASCIPAVTGAWKLEGGGAFHNNGDVFHLNNT